MPEEQDIPKQPTSEETTPEESHQDSTILQSDNQLASMEVHHHPDFHHQPKNGKNISLSF